MEDSFREKQNCRQCCMAIQRWVVEISTKPYFIYRFSWQCLVQFFLIVRRLLNVYYREKKSYRSKYGKDRAVGLTGNLAD